MSHYESQQQQRGKTTTTTSLGRTAKSTSGGGNGGKSSRGTVKSTSSSSSSSSSSNGKVRIGGGGGVGGGVLQEPRPTTYGEVTPEGLEILYQYVRVVNPEVTRFLDVGSGFGRQCMHLARSKKELRRCVGVEIGEARHAEAVRALDVWNQEEEDQEEEEPVSHKVDFVLGDICDIPSLSLLLRLAPPTTTPNQADNQSKRRMSSRSGGGDSQSIFSSIFGDTGFGFTFDEGSGDGAGERSGDDDDGSAAADDDAIDGNEWSGGVGGGGVFVWMSNLCFDDATNQRIFDKLLRELPNGTVLACSKIVGGDHEGLEMVYEALKIPMTWNTKSSVNMYVIKR